MSKFQRALLSIGVIAAASLLAPAIASADVAPPKKKEGCAVASSEDVPAALLIGGVMFGLGAVQRRRRLQRKNR
jgi:MYXO-CTERM domain-containing protein